MAAPSGPTIVTFYGPSSILMESGPRACLISLQPVLSPVNLLLDSCMYNDGSSFRDHVCSLHFSSSFATIFSLLSSLASIGHGVTWSTASWMAVSTLSSTFGRWCILTFCVVLEAVTESVDWWMSCMGSLVAFSCLLKFGSTFAFAPWVEIPDLELICEVYKQVEQEGHSQDFWRGCKFFKKKRTFLSLK